MSDKRKVKVWRASKTSQTAFTVEEGSAKMVGSRTNFIAADKEGVAISGNISFVTISENIRRGGLFLELNDFVRMIPTTIVTPMPSQIPWPPLGMITSLAKDLPIFLSLLAKFSLSGFSGLIR